MVLWTKPCKRARSRTPATDTNLWRRSVHNTNSEDRKLIRKDFLDEASTCMEIVVARVQIIRPDTPRLLLSMASKQPRREC